MNTRRCPWCFEQKPFSDFDRPNRKRKKSDYCKSCEQWLSSMNYCKTRLKRYEKMNRSKLSAQEIDNLDWLIDDLKSTIAMMEEDKKNHFVKKEKLKISLMLEDLRKSREGNQ